LRDDKKMKSISDLSSGADNIKSARGAKLRSAPKSEGTVYMDMFILHKKQARLKKEQQQLGKRNERIQQQLAEISDEMEQAKKNAEELESGEEAPKVSRRKPAKKWQTMTLDY